MVKKGSKAIGAMQAEERKKRAMKQKEMMASNAFSAWDVPTTTEADLLNLSEAGFLSSKELGEWNPPGLHCLPALATGEIMVFISFIERGFGLPTSHFL